MPISDPENYESGHFKKIYEDIFKVAITNAGYTPVRADDVQETNFIHLDILSKLIQSPMAICDLSSRNPNVLFELGLRQAFDKPTVIVQEFGTPQIFDIAPMRITNYHKELHYRQVIKNQKDIEDAIISTKKATENGEGINSIINLLSITSPASLMEISDNDNTKMLQYIMSELSDLKIEITNSNRFHKKREFVTYENSNYQNVEIEKAIADFSKFRNLVMNDAPYELKNMLFNDLKLSILKLLEMPISNLRREQLMSLLNQSEQLFLKNNSNN